MDLDMKDNMKMGKRMEKESIFGVMDQNTKVNEGITKYVAKFFLLLTYINFLGHLHLGRWPQIHWSLNQ